MARARNIKPSFFKNDLLCELPFEYRLLFAGLWTLADREGRLEDRPKKIKMEVFPADNVDVNKGLQALAENDFIERYEADGKRYIEVLTFLKHQNPHHREPPSLIPASGRRPMQQQESLGLDGDEYALRPGQAQGEPSASRAESPSLIPESPSRIPDSPSPAANGLAWVESFDRFWSAWPTHERKVDRGSCLAKWKKLGLHRIAHQVIAHVEAMKQSQSWQDGFVPLPMTYLNQARWEGAAPLGRPAPAGKQATLEARNRAAADSAKAKLFGTAPDAGAPHG